jgi:hypothetical protein
MKRAPAGPFALPITERRITRKERAMAKEIEWIEYKGKKILLCNFAGYDEAQYMAGVDAMEAELLKQPPKTRILHIVDVTDSHMTKATSDRGKQTVDVVGKAGIMTLTTMVGVTGIKRVIAQAIAKDVYFAKDMDDAKEYLATH